MFKKLFKLGVRVSELCLCDLRKDANEQFAERPPFYSMTAKAQGLSFETPSVAPERRMEACEARWKTSARWKGWASRWRAP